MNAIVFLLPAAVLLGAVFVVLFILAVRDGQFDDLDGAAWRAISDDDLPSEDNG